MSQAADTSVRQNRVPIMFSDWELKQIDDWRFLNRWGSRAEAVRRLVQASLEDAQACIEGRVRWQRSEHSRLSA